MNKLLPYVPALFFTLWTLCLNVLMQALIPLWHMWNILFWVSGYWIRKGKAWGCIPGLLPAAMILYFSTRTPGLSVERVVGLTLAMFYLGYGLRLWKKNKTERTWR